MSFKDIPIVTRSWIAEGDALFISNGVDAVAKLDGTDKEARYTIREANMVVVHNGQTYKVLGENKIEMPDGQIVILDPEAPPIH